jgi:hypothetical protein
MSGYIEYQKTTRRSKKRKPLVDGSLEASTAVTHTPYIETQPDGSNIIKHRLESLDSQPQKPTPDIMMQIDERNNDQFHNYEDIPNNTPPQTPPPRKRWVSLIGYVRK